MKITCNVIADLLPLYTEKMVSEDTELLVREHLADCPACREKAEKLSEQVGQVHSPAGDLPKLQKKIRQRRLFAALFAFLLTATVLLSAWAYLMSPVYLTAEEANLRVYYGDGTSFMYVTRESGVSSSITSVEPNSKIIEKGVLTLYFSNKVRRVTESRSTDPDTGKDCVTITASCRRMDLLFPMNPVEDVIWTIDSGFGQVYYASLDGRDDTLLWANSPPVGGVQTLPRLVLGYYVMIAAVLGCLLLAGAAVFRKTRGGKYSFALGCWFLCFVASLFLVCGGNLLADGGDVPWMFAGSLGLAALMTATLLLAIRTCKLCMEEKRI